MNCMKQEKVRFAYTDESGAFLMENPENIPDLAFPLCNEAGMMSSVTPFLHGDIKTGQQHFVTAPVTVEDLHNTKSARNFWLYGKGRGAFSASGNSARQHCCAFSENLRPKRTVEAGLLWHRLTLEDPAGGFRSEILNFVPAANDTVELMMVRLTNTAKEDLLLTPTAAIPIFARSAENIRDHRHVTSLVNRAHLVPGGLIVKPEIIFDEKGHHDNDQCYFVLGCGGEGTLPIGFFPEVHDFIGAAGSLDWPQAVAENRPPSVVTGQENAIRQGVEYIGALRFDEVHLAPEESCSYVLIIGTATGTGQTGDVFDRYNSWDKAQLAFAETCRHWTHLAEKITFGGVPGRFSEWMRWVGIQPVLRRIYGNSFMPYHDYGKGGRGWRDLWQDCLSLILSSPSEVRPMLLDNFAGVRLDGTNATIIGSKRGEFIADRNNIARVWMDHGAWPWVTTRLYIDQTGDTGFLFLEQSYFHDGLVLRASRRDPAWQPGSGTKQFSGTVLEHLLVQHLTSFFHVGEHNIMLLEGADWNDTLDMARERGESTAFTALYGGNLLSLADYVEKSAARQGITQVSLFTELVPLLDTLSSPIDYDNIGQKQTHLEQYMNSVQSGIAGQRAQVAAADLAGDLRAKGEWVRAHLRRQEWVEIKSGDGFFNGYYNNDGERVDGEDADGLRMNLTAQVFTTMFGLADAAQRHKAYEAVRKYLRDPSIKGIRLNTPLGKHRLNLGRCFSFAYGEKENGAVFSHMVVMYINALYRQNMVREAYAVFSELYALASDIITAGIYPGIPEYFNLQGKGMYPFLTGSASWLLLTVLTEMFGVRGEFGDLVITPRLMAQQFPQSGVLTCRTVFHQLRLHLTIVNQARLDAGAYRISSVTVNQNLAQACEKTASSVRIPMKDLMRCTDKVLDISITLAPPAPDAGE